MSSVWFALLFSSLSGKRGGFHVISDGVLRQNALKKYVYLKRCIERAEIGRHCYLSITRACQLLHVSASGLYSWLKSDQQHRHGVVHTDEFILTAVKGFIKQSRGYTPGLMSCYRHLRKQGLSIDYKRLRRIMRDNGLYHRYHRKYVKTTDSEHQLSCASNLLDRRFDNFGINEAWCGDITYIPTKQEWLYLASVIDLGTRRLVGYSFSSRMT